MKKFSTIMLCLIMLVTCALAGCASFTIDKVKYYNEVLVKVGDSNITRFDLLTAYSSYGYKNYVTMYGYTEQEALDKTLELLVENESIYQYALSYGDKYKPTAYQINCSLEELFDSVDSNMDSYVEEAKTILKIEDEEIGSAKTTDEDTAYLKSDYTYKKRATVANKDGEYVIQYIIEPDPEYTPIIAKSYLENFTSSGIVAELVAKYKSHLKSDLEIEEKENATIIYNKVISLFADDLINYEYYLRDENGDKYSTKTEDLIYRYFERSLKSSIKSAYRENIRIEYLKKDLSVSTLVEEFKNLTIADYNAYNNKLDDYKSKIKSIGTDGDDILYHPTLTDGTQFGYFLHCLIPFTDDDTVADGELSQTERIKALGSINQDASAKAKQEYEQAYNEIIAETSAKPRNLSTGKVDEDQVSKTLSQIIDEYNVITTLSDYNSKLEAFINFMFKYSTDTGTLSTGMPYVVGSYDETKGETYSTNSAMEEAFTNEAIKLMKTGVKGTMSTASISDIDNLCITSYGIHFVFYVGDVAENDIAYSNITNVYIQDQNKASDTVGYNLYNSYVNPITNETYFDLMFDKVYPASSDDEIYSSNNGYDDYEDIIVESMKSKTTRYDSKIKATKTSL